MSGCEGIGDCVASKLRDWREAEKDGRTVEAEGLQREIIKSLKAETKRMDRRSGTHNQHVDKLGNTVAENLSIDHGSATCVQGTDISVTRTKKGLAFSTDLGDKSAGFGVDLRPRRVIPKGDPGMTIPTSEIDPASNYQFEGATLKNADGSSVTRFGDGSRTALDATTKHRPQEIVNVGGDRTSFQYVKDASSPSRFFMTDKYGNAKGQGIKNAGDQFWSIDIPQEQRIRGLEQAKIVDVGVSKTGQFVMKSSEGIFYEQQRDGDFVTRDKSGRVISEVTMQGRATDFEYDGKDTKPKKYTVTNSQQKVVEIGVKTSEGWSIFRPDPSAKATDRKVLDGSKNAEPTLTVKDIHMDQRSGRLWQDAPQGDEVQRILQQDGQWRKNHGNQSAVIERGPNGEALLTQFDAKDGAVTRVQYDKTGQPIAINLKAADRYSHSFSYVRADANSGWKTADGTEAAVEVLRLPDGSIRVIDEGSGRIQTQYINGSESVQTRNSAGKYLVRRSTDSHGTSHQIDYNIATHEPIRVTTKNTDGQSEVWTITSPLSHAGKHDVWKSKHGTKTFEGKVTVRPDGSVRFEPVLKQ